MKRFLILISFVLLASLSFGQQGAQEVDATIPYGDSWSYVGLQNVTDVHADGAWDYVVRHQSTKQLQAEVFFEIDSISGTPEDLDVTLYRKLAGPDSWTSVESVTYAGSADTTITLSTSSFHTNEFWKAEISEPSGDFDIDLTNFLLKSVEN